jgi:hypothetical protein
MKLFPGFIAGALLCLSATAITFPASAEEAAQPAPAASVANVRHGNVVWRGEVDGTVDISLRHRTVRATVVSGRSVRREHQHFRVTGFLPARDTVVRLEGVEGQGTVEITQQPDSSNNFTAIVRLANSQPGRQEFHFTLAW